MNRNRIATVVIGIIAVLLVVAGVGLWRSKDHPRSARHRTLVTQLGYCSPEAIQPCITAFSQMGDGNMQVNLLVPSVAYPNFYLAIDRGDEENRYACKKGKESLTQVACSGKELFPGEVLQFRIVSVRDEKVLAAGNFAIIGLLLVTPGVEATMTPTATATVTQTPTPISLEVFTPVVITPETPTPDPSYPNP